MNNLGKNEIVNRARDRGSRHAGARECQEGSYGTFQDGPSWTSLWNPKLSLKSGMVW